MEKPIRDQVDGKMALLRDSDSLDPQTIAKILIDLSALWSSVNKEIVGRKSSYNVLKRDLLLEHKKGNLAIIHAEATQEYHDLLEAEAYGKSVQEAIRTGKKFLILVDSEMREAMR